MNNTDNKTQLFLGNNIELLRQLPDNSVDAIVTDPPYGLGEEPNPTEVLQSWITTGYHEIEGKGFMGKEWDAFVPQPIFWKEAYRVLKHGGHVLSFFGTRTYDWGVMAMRFAGFEVRDCIQWLYGSGFPKSLSVSKSIDKKEKDGWHKMCKSLDNLDKNYIIEVWKEKLSSVKCVGLTLKKNIIEIGMNMQKKDFVQSDVVLNFNQEKFDANAIIAELNLIEVLRCVEGNQSIVQENVEVNIEQLPNHAKYVVKSLPDLNPLYWKIFSALLNVKELQNVKTIHNHKVEEALKIWHGGQKSLKEEDICVLCVEVVNDLKHIILSQSKTFLNLDTNCQMECVSAINVIITEYMAVNLISNMVSILKSKAIDKMQGAEREVLGKVQGMGKQNPEWNGMAKGRSENSFKSEYEKTAPATDAAKQWDGWGSALKPANEPIVLARKPLEKGLSIAENVLKHSTGGLNIDGCRVGNEVRTMPIFSQDKKEDDTTFNLNSNIQHHREETSQGRFPANLILTHHPDCECIGTKKVKAGKNIEEKGSGGIWQKSSGLPCGNQYGDENGEETVENWNCHPDCPVKLLDEQSGQSKSSDTKRTRNTIGSFGMPNDTTVEYNDFGGASRFFYTAKASKEDRNEGLKGFEETFYAAGNQAKAELKRGNTDFNANEGKGREERNNYNQVGANKNFHPTVKPTELMRYLCRLITPPNGVVLDPFMGSGSTGKAAILEGFKFIGMELEEEYFKIAEARIAKAERDYLDSIAQLKLF